MGEGLTLFDRPKLEVAVQHRVGALTLEVSFTLQAPWTVLFAPSGAGKSTVLRVVAGLVRPDRGRVVAGSVILVDTDAGVHLPAHRRGVRLAGQEAALFPHLTVLGNVAYGMGGADPREVMALCRVSNLSEKMPVALSGGERQRVALARALGGMPARMLLLDEPFSALDVGQREELVGDVRGWLAARAVPVLQVTHDVGEVFALDAEVIRMQHGRVVAQGRANEVLREERRWLAAQLERGGG